MPYSLSRWTDVPAAKWAWFLAQLDRGYMLGIDPRTATPYYWSLAPEDVLGLTFWTKDPLALVLDRARLAPYAYKVNVTVTGWVEVEKGAPGLSEGPVQLKRTAELLGPDRVIWRFSPVPLLPDDVVVERFAHIARIATKDGNVNQAICSFLQPNDRVPETRTAEERRELLRKLAEVGAAYGVRVGLCKEDQTLYGRTVHPNLATVICAPPEDFGETASMATPTEGCGCALAVDPFGPNESCTFGCAYCYAADKNLAPRKASTTRSLPVLP